MKNKKTLGYKIVRGLPVDVEYQVQNLIDQGWKEKGNLLQIKHHTSGVDLLVQNMVLYKNG